MKTRTIIIFFQFILFVSCSNIQTYPGKALIVNRSIDNSLQDSAMIYGYVLDAKEKKPLSNCTILVKETNSAVYSDSTGYFFLKLLPETYTVMCFAEHSDTLLLENLKILTNEKVEVKFLRTVVIYF